MSNAKAINLYLMDGDLKGRIKCATKNWIGIAYKIPKDKINEAKEMEALKKLGIYFLFGKNKENKQTIYVGQATQRANGNGLLGRILEEHKNQNNQNIDINAWTEAIAFSIKDTDSIDTDDLKYLENKFYNLATIANRYYVLNQKEPDKGNQNEEKESQLEEFVKYVKLFTEILGHKVFEPITEDEIISNQVNEITNSKNNIVINNKTKKTVPQQKREEPISENPVGNSIKEKTLKDITFSKELKFTYLKILGEKDDVKTARDIYQKLVQKYVKTHIKLLSNYNKKNPIIIYKKIKLYSQEHISNKRKNKTDIDKRYKNISEDWYLNVDCIVSKLEQRIRKIVSLMGISEDKIIIGYYSQNTVISKSEGNNESANPENTVISDSNIVYYSYTYKKEKAYLKKINDKEFILLKGSKISPDIKQSCDDNIKKERNKYKDKINSDGVLLEDIKFDNLKFPSGIAKFITGSSVSGKDWKEEPNFSVENIKIPIINNNDDLLYMDYKEAKATCKRTNKGFLVLKGSKINKEITNSCGKEIIKSREEHKDKIDSSYILKEDILFSSSSRSAGFVAGNNVNGKNTWKDKNGKSLKEL